MTNPLTNTMPAWEDGGRIPDRYALGKPGEPMDMSDNVSPEISWSSVPEGTKSIAIIVSDSHVRSVALDINSLGFAADELTGPAALGVIDGHVLAHGSYTGIYSLGQP